MALNFDNDIKPIFGPYVDQMKWRFDLSDYDQVKANATLIDTYISGDPDLPRMPPVNFAGAPALSSSQIATFKQWIAEGCPK